LRNLFLLIFLGFGVYKYLNEHTSLLNTGSVNQYFNTQSPSSEMISQPSSQFSCQGKTHCSQMGSYEEAKFYLDNCPGTKMDGDGDGVPCERQF
jgi:hypothetical protein